MSVLSIDFETRATVDLKKTGVYPYAQHRDTDIWCMAWAFDDEEPEIWTPQDGHADDVARKRPHLPPRVVQHIADGGEIRAWNAQFERVIWNNIMVLRYGVLPVKMEQWVCSAAEAAAMALPRGLDQAARVLGVKQTKDTEGYNLMMRMTRPRKVNDDGSIVWWDVEERKQRLYEYCKQDVRVERAIVKCLRRLTPKEREVYLFDQRCNDRGIHLDRELVLAAKDVADDGVTRANSKMRELTDGTVSGVKNHTQLANWLVAEGAADRVLRPSIFSPTGEMVMALPSVSKKSVVELLEREDLSPKVREVLETRADAGRTSLAKLDSMLHVACRDNQLRGLVLYHAASTGRFGGKLVQPHNFPRGEVENVETYIDAVLARDYDFIDLFAHPIVVISSMLRAMITARPGHELIAADFSAIEARVLNWLAGQDDVCEFFRQYDAGDKTKDPYKQMAVRMGRAPSVDLITKQDRQAGKAAELGCGFGMGADKFVKAAWDVYQVRVTAEEAKSAVDIYRASHPLVKDLWYATENACVEAIRTPGVPVTFGGRRNLKAVVAGAYLYIVLPSGRPLCYAAPKLVELPTPWSTPEKPVTKMTITYMGIDPLSKQWGRLRTYGGHLVENIVQAGARDLLVEGMLRAEQRGYPAVMHVHDEAVVEVPTRVGSLKEFKQIMSELPDWASGCPVAAEGWRGFRYRK